MELNPSDDFALVKNKRNTVTDEDLSRIYDNCLELLNKAVITGQTKAAKKLVFHLDTIEREREIVKKGVNTFVYEDDITEYMQNIAKDVVKIIELKDYEREIPEDVILTYSKVKDYFDVAYVVFTDYTGKIEKQVEKERREKDPILFGSFQEKSSGTLIERFYFIGDWEDEYCDLTLDKMVSEFRAENDVNILHEISTPKSLDELKMQLSILNEISENSNEFRIVKALADVSIEKKDGFLKRMKRIFIGG